MAFTQNSSVLYSDLSTLITNINAESTTRGGGATVPFPGQSTKTLSADIKVIEALRRIINTYHKQPGRDAESWLHPGGGYGGRTLSLTDYSADLSIPGGVNPTLLASIVSQINTDVNSLIAQCDCDTFYAAPCTGHGCAPNCNCNTNGSYGCNVNTSDHYCCNGWCSNYAGSIGCINCCNIKCSCYGGDCTCNPDGLNCCNTTTYMTNADNNGTRCINNSCYNGCSCNLFCQCEYN